MILKDDYINAQNEAGEKILEFFPNTKALFEIKGSIKDYYKSIEIKTSSHLNSRRSSFYNAIRCTGSSLFPLSVIENVLKELSEIPIASSAEHVCAITNPEILNTILGQTVFRVHKEQTCIISFAGAGLKLCNELDSRFFYINSEKKVSLLPGSKKNMIIFTAPAIDVFSLKEKIKNIFSDDLSTSQSSILLQWLFPLLDKMSEFQSFWEQISFFNYKFWNLISSNTSIELPKNLVMLPIEKLVGDALIDDINESKNSWVTQTLFSQEKRNILHTGLNGNRSCWDTEKNKGSFLFWGVDTKNRPVRLLLKNNKLVSKDQSIVINFEKEAIVHALSTKQIYPAASLCFIYCSFYLGLNFFGGIFQIQYLPDMLEKFCSLAEVLSLSVEDNKILHSIKADLYVNFETSEIAKCGLLRVLEPISELEWGKYTNHRFLTEIQG